MSNQELMDHTTEERMQQQIDELNTKMDRILDELAWQRQQRMAYQDLQEDLIKIGNDAFKTAVERIDGYADVINSKEIQQLAWNLARNVRNMNKVVKQMESGMALLEDATPIIRQSIIDLTKRLNEWDQKGYFRILKALVEEVGNVAETMDEQEIHAAGNKLSHVLQTAREVDWSKEDKASLFSLFRELRSPEVKKSLSIMLLLLKTLGQQTPETTETSDQ